MDGALWFAQQLKERNNPSGYSPVFGTIETLEPLCIRLSSTVTLGKDHVQSIIDLYEKVYSDDREYYKNLGKEAVLLPYSEKQKVIVIGILQ